MYLYIYDSFLSEPKYESILAAIERRVTDLDIKGKIARLSVLKNIKELVADGVKNGVTTVVAIGDDQTFAKVINIAAQFDVTLGIIPVTTTSTIARVLGIPPKEHACEVLAARIIKRLDLGKINSQYFLNQAQITNAAVTITCDGFSLQPTTELNSITICNVGGTVTANCNPTDGILEAIITPIESNWLAKRTLQSTVLPFKKIMIRSRGEEEVSILTDEQIIMKTPAEIVIAPSQLRVIVGSNRQFE